MDRKSRILEFNFSDESEKRIFFRKLSDLNGWSEGFCQKAFTEYKRFIYLSATTGGRVVPSKVIDSVWHLHLTFTKSYWHDFCRDRIGKDIHHNPSQPDAESKIRDHSDYQKTLELYRTTFGAEPADGLWTNAGGRCTRKAASRHLWIALVGATTLLAACSADSGFGVPFGFFLVFIFLLFSLSSLFSGGSKKKKGRKRGAGSGTASGSNCSSYSDCSSCSSGSSCGGGGGD